MPCEFTILRKPEHRGGRREIKKLLVAFADSTTWRSVECLELPQGVTPSARTLGFAPDNPGGIETNIWG